MTRDCIPLTFASDASLVGGKAFNLYRLIKGGFNVPKGFVCVRRDTQAESVMFAQLKSPLIVRSSANLEDGSLLSFAGVLESFAPINTPSELHAHIQKIFSLKESIKLSEYLRYYNIAENTVNINCIVQEWKRSLWSGVMFTTRKHTGQLVCSIEATKRAAGVVSGEGEVVRLVVPHGITVGDLDTQELPVELVNTLTETGQKIENYFGSPQDVEWVWDGTQVYVVQTRPITEQQIEPEALIENEIRKLKESIATPPLLDQNQFADGMVTATPLTASLFGAIFAKGGSLECVVKKFGVSTKLLQNHSLVVYMFGRLYLNKTIEDSLIQSWKGSRNLFSLRSLYTLIKFQYRFLFFWKQFESRLKQIRVSPSGNSVESLTAWIVKDVTPMVLEVAMHQQYAETIIRKKLKEKVTSEEIDSLLVSEMGELENKEEKVDLLKKYGHRAFQELELSSPRFSEKPELLQELFSKKGSTEASKKSSELRKTVIAKLPSILDQQTLASTLYLYDKYTKQREKMHDEWVKAIGLLRSELLRIDRKLGLYNSIWYAELHEVLAEVHLSPVPLFERRAKFLSLSHLNLPSQLQLKDWDELEGMLAAKEPVDPATTLAGVGVSAGLARGRVGTMEELQIGIPVEVLAARSLDPSLVLVFGRIKAVVAEVGGSLSHAAIIAREYGIPVVVADKAMQIIGTNSEVEVNGTLGTVAVLKKT